MELLESEIWVALGFGPMMAAFAGASEARLLRAAKAGSRAKEEEMLYVC